jgi:nucleotide-binding universal stress UspA family protein
MAEQDHQSDTVLVAVDGSPSAQVAAEIGLKIAKSDGLKVRGLYVVDETLVLDMYADYAVELGRNDQPVSRAELVRWFEERGSRELEWLGDRCAAAAVPCSTEILFGGVPELIQDEASHAHLLALGRRGNGHSSDPDHLGRYFRAIAHHYHGAILAGGDEVPPVQNLLLAYNDSEQAQHALEWASRLQRRSSSQVIVLRARDEPDVSEQELAEMRAQIEKAGLVDSRIFIKEGPASVEIVKAADDNPVGLIVMGGYHHNALLEWLVGSTLDRVLRSTPLSVLIA